MSIASSGQQVTDSLNGKLTFEQDKNRIVGRDEDNLIRLLILANGTDFVMKVAKEGYDALSATDAQLVFNSDQNVLKVVKTNTATVTVLAAQTSAFTTIPHGLSYTPIPLVFYTFDAGTSYQPAGVPYVAENGALSGKVYQTTYAYTTATNLVLQAVLPDIVAHGTTVFTFKYYLLQESAS